MMSRRWTAVAGAALLPAATVLQACSGDQSELAEAPGSVEVPAWTLAAAPDVSVGVVEGDERYQMHQVVGAARLEDGSIAVMNAGSSELRIYGPDGAFVAARGRAGDGPGEFRRATRMHLIADTIFVYDGGLQRLSLHDQTGAFLDNRTLRPAPGRFQLDEWLYDRSWIDGPPLGIGRAAVMNAIAALPPPDSIDLFRYVRVSPYGHLWVRQRSEPGDEVVGWRVYDMNAVPVGDVQLPARFEVLEFGPDYLLGRGRDELDVEFVQLLRLDPSHVPHQRLSFTASAADTVRQLAADTAFTAQRQAMVGALRMLNTTQEIYYSSPGGDYGYATDIAQLTGYEVPEGVDMRIVAANERGWLAVAIHRASGRMCGVAVGLTAPPGWMPGVVSCQ